MKGKPDLYVFNAFFMTMRSKFVEPGTSIHCYEVQWSPSKLSWDAFRNQVLGPTDPADGPVGSLRKTILEQWKELGLTSPTRETMAFMLGAVSPFEDWLKRSTGWKRKRGRSVWCRILLKAGLSATTIKSGRTRVTMSDGSKGSIFDALEDMNAGDCLAKMVGIERFERGDEI
jgi:hypothetical protein